MGTTDHEAQPAPKVAPEGVALRAAPRAVTRLNRRTLAVSAAARGGRGRRVDVGAAIEGPARFGRSDQPL